MTKGGKGKDGKGGKGRKHGGPEASNKAKEKFAGECWTCGKSGHRSSDRRSQASGRWTLRAFRGDFLFLSFSFAHTPTRRVAARQL
eukprot:6154625-Amphidinium_carterae.1